MGIMATLTRQRLRKFSRVYVDDLGQLVAVHLLPHDRLALEFVRTFPNTSPKGPGREPERLTLELGRDEVKAMVLPVLTSG